VGHVMVTVDVNGVTSRALVTLMDPADRIFANGFE
jgi:hypothetical protein